MNEITYTRIGDYYLPNIALTEPPGAPLLGRYGMMHREYLRRGKPALYAELLLSERLHPLCRDVDEAAAHRLATIADRYAAHEVILSELVYI
ncbi:TnpV protein [Oscillospiraceae bacterium OttesenSCG-928-F05]|nr:TnpV protein [Oscillospiraceae bacterium OttesenSCG-928-F05]